MLQTESSMKENTMYSDHSFIIADPKSNNGKCPWKSHYMFIDCVTNPNFTNGSLVVICEERRPSLKPFRKKLFTLAIVVAFIVGFTLGVVIPFYLPPKEMSNPLNSKESSGTKNQTQNYKTALSLTALKQITNSSLQNRLVDGIFWSDYVEKSLPVGFGDKEDQQWKNFVQKSAIVRIEAGCGRMQNRLVTFEDGTKACCRYRQNTDQIQGEIFSYHLGRLLKLDKLAPSTLAVINSSDPLWLPVKSQLQASQWAEDHPVVLTKFVEGLLPAQIPLALRHFTSDFFALDNHIDASSMDKNMFEMLSSKANSEQIMSVVDTIKTKEEMIEMAQWSDLIIFDYLTANLDRIVNNLYNLQWNLDMLSSPAHNLARTAVSGLLVFLDNESGLLHGYRLLDKYEPYHSLLLNALCIFRKSTVDALSTLSLHDHPGLLLSQELSSNDLLPPLPERNVNILSERIARVLRQVVSCAQRQHLHS